MIIPLGQRTDWKQPGNVGNTGGASSAKHGTFPFTPAKPASFAANPASPYDTGYSYVDLTPDLKGLIPTYFVYKLKFMFPTEADLAACQAPEFEIQQNFKNQVFNMAWSVINGLWCSFDYTNSAWIETEIPANLTAGKWIKVRSDFVRGGDNSLTHLTLRLNGKTNVVNIKRTASPKVEPAYVHAAFQLDSNAFGTPYKVIMGPISVEMY